MINNYQNKLLQIGGGINYGNIDSLFEFIRNKSVRFIYSLVNHKKIESCVFIYIDTFYQ